MPLVQFSFFNYFFLTDHPFAATPIKKPQKKKESFNFSQIVAFREGGNFELHLYSYLVW